MIPATANAEEGLVPLVAELAGVGRITNRNLLDLAIRAPRAVIDGVERAVALSIRHGTIVAIDGFEVVPLAPTVLTLPSDVVLIPGLVDTHVHINEPGRTEWEGFESATAAAAAAGVTTIVDMPLNSLPPTLTAGALAVKRKAARGRCHVDVGFWGGAVPTNLTELPELFAAGVFGVKCFLQDSGVPEFPPLSTTELRQAMEIIAGLDGLLLVHAEDPGRAAHLADAAGAQLCGVRAVPARHGRGRRHRNGDPGVGSHRLPGAHRAPLVGGRWRSWSAQAKTAGVPDHRRNLPALPDSRRRDDSRTAAPQFKCCPPIRGTTDQDALWAALADGTIDIVVTDHSPSTPALKLLEVGDLGLAWGGIASLQFGFAAVLAEAHRREHPADDRCCAGWRADRPIWPGCRGRVGSQVGADADLVVLADAETFTVTADSIRHRHPVTPVPRPQPCGEWCAVGGCAAPQLQDDMVGGSVAACRAVAAAQTVRPRSAKLLCDRVQHAPAGATGAGAPHTRAPQARELTWHEAHRPRPRLPCPGRVRAVRQR